MAPFVDPVAIAQFFVCCFFAVLFLQSGFDKVFDFNGNLSWMQPHFAQSPFRNKVPMLLALMMVLEVAAGAASGLGAVMLLFGHKNWAVIGLGLCCLAFVNLFAGQRISKDYEGAVSIATYFGVALIGLILLG
ncbi:MAG TPA: hypothetical protein VNI20_06340 [Fimbriimonadaceae bacterium]|nr:hypothetical protein [Fimbriimonadaceae bacterium]